MRVVTVDETQKIVDVARLVQAVTMIVAKPVGAEPSEEEWGYLTAAAGRVLELVLFRRPTDEEVAALFS